MESKYGKIHNFLRVSARQNQETLSSILNNQRHIQWLVVTTYLFLAQPTLRMKF